MLNPQQDRRRKKIITSTFLASSRSIWDFCQRSFLLEVLAGRRGGGFGITELILEAHDAEVGAEVAH
jgi:hypothetical protein